MLLADAARVGTRPARGFAAILEGDPPTLRAAAALVVVTGVLAAGVSAAAAAVEPQPVGGRAAALGVSAVLPVLFVAVWLIDALIVDAVAQLMGATTRLRTWAVLSAHAIPVLLVLEVVRLAQAALDRGGTAAADASVYLGLAGLLVLAWFVVVIAAGIRALYDLAGLPSVAAALAPPAAMSTVLVVLLVVLTAVHG